MELQLVDAREWVLARSERFFPRGKPEPIYLLAWLMADVLELSGGACTVRRSGEWWMIGSEVDWLQVAGHSEVELFGRVVPAPGHGEHSMRGEVLMGTFARSVSTSLNQRSVRIKGDEPPPEVWEQAKALHRVIVFSM